MAYIIKFLDGSVKELEIIGGLHFSTNVDLSGDDLRKDALKGVDLKGAVIIEADFRGANLEGINLEGAILIRTSFKGANLSKANLRGANLRGANLEGADLTGALGLASILV